MTITFKAGSKVAHGPNPHRSPHPNPHPHPHLTLTQVTHDASGQWVSFVKESSMDSVFGALHGAPTPG